MSGGFVDWVITVALGVGGSAAAHRMHQVGGYVLGLILAILIVLVLRHRHG